MQELIKVTEENGQKMVSARDLHTFLGNGKQFADWIKTRIRKYGFVEGQDYTAVSLNGESGGRSIEYALTLEMAKELAMVEGNAKGKQARRYFIECERQARAQLVPKSQADLILLMAQQNLEHERRLKELQERTRMLEAKMNTSTGNYFSIMGYARLKRRPVSFKEAAAIGKRATALCGKEGLSIGTVPDPRYGKVNIYPVEVLERVFNVPR